VLKKEESVLANTRSALKKMRQAEKRRVRNRLYRSRARTFVKKTQRLLSDGDLDAARQAAIEAASALDRAAEKGIIHKNNAARRKSRLMRKLNQALQAPA
jgi:small subunit ribosomal protein S20